MTLRFSVMRMRIVPEHTSTRTDSRFPDTKLYLHSFHFIGVLFYKNRYERMHIRSHTESGLISDNMEKNKRVSGERQQFI